jgi:protein-tyrosine-phosphatase
MFRVGGGEAFGSENVDPSSGRCEILFVCTGNCCRSQMAEALLRHMGGSRFRVQSGGTNPAGYVHPLVVEAMGRLGVPVEGLSSKSWEIFAEEPQDAIITLCDVAALCPAPRWAGRPATAHWSLADPSFVPGNEETRVEAALAAARQLRGWLEDLLKLPIDELTAEQFEVELRRIGGGGQATGSESR